MTLTAIIQETKKAVIDATANHGNAAGGFMGAVGAVENLITDHYSVLMFFMAGLSILSSHMIAKNRLKFDQEQAAKKKKVKK